MTLKRILLLLLAVWTFSGCAVLNFKSQDKELLLKQRVNDYIAFKNSQAADKEYEFLTPEYRKKISLVKFIKLQQKKIENMTVKSIDFVPGDDTANIELEADITAMGFSFQKVTFKQKWVLVDNQWYYDAKITSFKQLFMPQNSSGKTSGK